MFIYLLQLREATRGRPGVVLFFAVFATVVWIMWAIKTLLSRRYRPWTDPYETTASIIIPVVDEPPELFRDVLQRVSKQDPFEVIVVINGERNPVLEDICADTGVRWRWTEVPGKRNAIREAMDFALGEIVVLVDSDTLWVDDTLEELLKPFADPRIGGVTTKQRILEPRRNFLTKWADWMENSRSRYSLPAQSSLGTVGCLPGRTIAFRREIVNHVMHDFMTEEFLGVYLEVSDDRTLTNLCLKQGYRTVYQETSEVFTDSPTKIKKLYKQQLRWARGSQYNTLRMLPWMAGHAPVLALFFLTDILLPFILMGALFSWIYHSATHTGVNFLSPTLEAFPGVTGWALAAGLIVVGGTLSTWLRQHRHLRDVPADLFWMPAYVLFSTAFLMPIRLLGFFRMAHAASWGTRRHAYPGRLQGDFSAVLDFNPFAAIPYLVGAAVLLAEVALVVRYS